MIRPDKMKASNAAKIFYLMTNGGGRSESFYYHMNDISVYLDRGREGSPIVKISLRPLRLSAGLSNVHKATNIPLLSS